MFVLEQGMVPTEMNDLRSLVAQNLCNGPEFKVFLKALANILLCADPSQKLNEGIFDLYKCSFCVVCVHLSGQCAGRRIH